MGREAGVFVVQKDRHTHKGSERTDCLHIPHQLRCLKFLRVLFFLYSPHIITKRSLRPSFPNSLILLFLSSLFILSLLPSSHTSLYLSPCLFLSLHSSSLNLFSLTSYFSISLFFCLSSFTSFFLSLHFSLSLIP